MRRLLTPLLGGLFLVGFVLWVVLVDRARTHSADAGNALPADGTLYGGEPALVTQTVDAGADAPGPTPGTALADPILVAPCSLLPIHEQDVSSQVDGVFQEILVSLGQHVSRGQVLGRLDDRQLRPQVELLEIKAASQSAELSAKAQHDEANGKVEYALKANKSGLQSVSELEYQTYLFQRERFRQEMQKAREEQQTARKELEKARCTLDLHQIKSGLSGEVVKIYKRDGEAVKQMEPLFRVANVDRLWVEGLCKVQQADMIRVGMKALVEPEIRSEQITELSGHTGSITGLTVSPDGRSIASASEDRTVMLWHWPQGIRQAVLPHPVEVHAVAFGPAQSGGAIAYHLLTGAGDGQGRIWSISRQGAIHGPTFLANAHVGAIRAVAFSPNGKWCATGGEDKQIAIWELDSNRCLYRLQTGTEGQAPAHQGAVTTIHFTPDGCLVSAGRDNTLKVWRLSETGALLLGSQPGRTGDAVHLGISADGQRVLFDHGEELRILNRSDWSCVGLLRSRRQEHFHTLALFAPSNTLVLTAANNGRLQLWKVPATPEATAFLRRAYTHGFDRSSLSLLAALTDTAPLAKSFPAWSTLGAPSPGQARDVDGCLVPQLWSLSSYEVRYFLTSNTMAVTCAAFVPDETALLTGGADKTIRAWPVPSSRELCQPLEARITYVSSQVERGTDLVRIRAELQNPHDPSQRLRPGTFANLRLYPETAAKR